jgi:hypothetical protein
VNSVILIGRPRAATPVPGWPPSPSPERSFLVTPNDAFEFFVERVSQLFHADALMAEQAQGIEVLEAELARFRKDTDATWEPAA